VSRTIHCPFARAFESAMSTASARCRFATIGAKRAFDGGDRRALPGSAPNYGEQARGLPDPQQVEARRSSQALRAEVRPCRCTTGVTPSVGLSHGGPTQKAPDDDAVVESRHASSQPVGERGGGDVAVLASARRSLRSSG